MGSHRETVHAPLITVGKALDLVTGGPAECRADAHGEGSIGIGTHEKFETTRSIHITGQSAQWIVAVVTAYGRALATLSRDIAQAVRTVDSMAL